VTARAKKKFDARKYGRLLAQVQPRPIQSEEENERLLGAVDRLMAKSDDEPVPEEDVLLELLCQLIERFEEEHYPIPDSPPHRVLQFLMEQNDVPESDLLPILGSRGQVAEVLTGKRSISKAQAKALSEFFPPVQVALHRGRAFSVLRAGLRRSADARKPAGSRWRY
jgi:HTH-type transcriptional regulator/antitoxin HigA